MPNPLTKQQIPLSNPLLSDRPNPRDPAWAAWQARVDRGLIGSRTPMSFDLRLRHMSNEIALFGRVVTRELSEF